MLSSWLRWLRRLRRHFAEHVLGVLCVVWLGGARDIYAGCGWERPNAGGYGGWGESVCCLM